LIDTKTGDVRFLNFLNHEDPLTGDYSLMRKKDNILILAHSTINYPSTIYSLTFTELSNNKSIDQVKEGIKV
jgi:hypothetical protein